MEQVAIPLKWFMVVFFTGFGAWSIANRHCVGSARELFAASRGDDSVDRRICEALENRADLDRNTPAPGLVTGAVALVFAVLTVVTKTPLTLLYGAFILIYALVLTAHHLAARYGVQRRAASLEVRRPNRVLPWYAFGPAIVVALVPLLYLDGHGDAAALVVMTAALLIVGLATAIASAPARIGDADLGVARFVDAKLRTGRSLQLLALGTGAVYVFVSFTGYTDSLEHQTAFAVSLATFCGLFVALMVTRRRAPSARDIGSWGVDGG